MLPPPPPAAAASVPVVACRKPLIADTIKRRLARREGGIVRGGPAGWTGRPAMVSYEPDVVSSQRSSNGRTVRVRSIRGGLHYANATACLHVDDARRSAFAAACLRYRPASIFNATGRRRPFVHCRTAIAAAPYSTSDVCRVWRIGGGNRRDSSV